MTIEDTRAAILAYVNNADSTKSLAAIQVIINGLINNASNIDNLTLILTALQNKIGS